MNVFVARRSWLANEASRLGATTFGAGGLQARERLLQLPCETLPLAEAADVFAVSLRQRQFVRDPQYGTWFLASSDLSRVDPPRDFFLSKARTPQLDAYVVDPGWSLISATGTVGSVIYVNDDLAGAAISQDAIRVSPKAVLPGYLFAFLASATAISIIRLRTFGTTVDRIHPEQISDLPVPIADAAFQQRVHHLVQKAADARVTAMRLLDETDAYFDSVSGTLRSRHDHDRAVRLVTRSSLNRRLDAFHHVGWAAEPQFSSGDRIDEIAAVTSTNRVPRIYVERGVPFLSGIDVFRIRAEPRVRLATRVADAFQAYVSAGELAIQGSGQRYGLVGRVAYIGRRLDGWAASHDLFRIRTDASEQTARLYAFLRSDSGHRVMLRHSYGTSIPHVNPPGIAALKVPTLPKDLVQKTRQAIELRQQADEAEDTAIQEIEAWLG